MKKLVVLEYTFLFEPESTYQHLFQFESDLAKFFDAKDLQAEVLKTIEGAGVNRMMYICKKDIPVMPSRPEPVGRPKGLKRVINDLRNRNMTTPERHFKEGRLVKSKGYIKRETHV
jgi:hypothetical protein